MRLFRIAEGQATLGELDKIACPDCGECASPVAKVDYRYLCILYIFSLFVVKREYFTTCSQCQSFHPASEETRETICAKFPRNHHIPFMHKKGWLAILAAIAILPAYEPIESWHRNSAIRDYLAAPKAGDVYMADFSAVFSITLDEPYGGLKLIEQDGENFVFAIGKHMSKDTWEPTDRMIQDSVASSPYLYLDKRHTLTREEVDALTAKGSIYAVYR